MTEPKNNCLICGEDLVYKESLEIKKCHYCGGDFESQAVCREGHFICDVCHASPAVEIIRKSCLHSTSVNPVRLATGIMKHPSVKMHGPEHHFLVPVVLRGCCRHRHIHEPGNRFHPAVNRRMASEQPDHSPVTHVGCPAWRTPVLQAGYLYFP